MSEQALTVERTALSEPTRDLAERLLGTVGFDERLVGLKMSAKGGSNPTPLYTLVDAANFIHVGDYQTAQTDNSATVGYIAPAALALWIEEVLGDAELAAAVREHDASGDFYGAVADPIKELLIRRVEQARASVAPAPADEAVEPVAEID